MKKAENFAFITCPMIFGLVLVFIGMYAIKQRPDFYTTTEILTDSDNIPIDLLKSYA